MLSGAVEGAQPSKGWRPRGESWTLQTSWVTLAHLVSLYRFSLLPGKRVGEMSL